MRPPDVISAGDAAILGPGRRGGVAPLAFWSAIAAGGLLLGCLTGLAPMAVRGAVGGVLALWLVSELVLRAARRGQDGERLHRLLKWAIALRIVFVGVHLMVALWFYAGETDLRGYMKTSGDVLDRVVEGRRMEFLDDLGPGTAATVLTLAGVAVVTGHVLWAMFLVSAAASVVSAYLWLRAYQRAFPTAPGQRFLTLCLLFLPAVAFWSTFMGKDFICALLTGWASYGLAGLLRRINLADALAFGLSLVALMLVRAHIGIAVGLAGVLAIVVRQFTSPKPRGTERVAVLMAFALLAPFVSVTALARLGVQEATVEAVATHAQRVHAGYANTPGTTTQTLAIDEPTPGAVLRFLPWGIVTLLFRPFLWEAHNVLAIAAGAENLFLMALVLWRWRPLLRSLRAAVRQPFVLYALVALVGGAAALALEWNLGTMARHRTMVVPYLLVLLAGVETRAATRLERRKS